MGGVIIILTRGIANQRTDSRCCLILVGCLMVGVPVPKILLLDILVCTVAASRGEYTSLCVRCSRRALNGSVLFLVTVYLS